MLPVIVMLMHISIPGKRINKLKQVHILSASTTGDAETSSAGRFLCSPHLSVIVMLMHISIP